jgi:hypothetical protein
LSAGRASRRTARQRATGALVVALAAVVAACFVGRKSSDYECSTTDDCETGRICDRGFCVSGASVIDASLCPAACNGGCDLVAKTCAMRCDQTSKCNNVTCPAGYACTISCTGTNVCSGQICPAGAQSCDITCASANACSNLRCGTSVGCAITCSATNACQDVFCGPSGRCNVKCQAANACGTVSCGSSCACDVSCPTGGCDGMVCPMLAGSSSYCTTDGLPTSQCLSTATGCSTCP